MNYLTLLVRLSSNDGFEYLGLDVSCWFAILGAAGLFWGLITVGIAYNRGYGDEQGKWFLVGFVLGLIGVIIAASTAPRNSQGVTNVPTVNTIPKDNSNVGAASPEIENLERLKKYKELLDMGAITQEEFELKKNEILKIK